MCEHRAIANESFPVSKLTFKRSLLEQQPQQRTKRIQSLKEEAQNAIKMLNVYHIAVAAAAAVTAMT